MLLANGNIITHEKWNSVVAEGTLCHNAPSCHTHTRYTVVAVVVVVVAAVIVFSNVIKCVNLNLSENLFMFY